MKSTIEMLDNKHQGRVISTLKEHIATNSTVSVISSEFSLHAFTELKKHLKKINKFKLLVAADFNNKDNFINNLQGGNLDRHLRNQLNISSIARECSKWLQLIRNKVNNPINSNNKKIIIFTAFARLPKLIIF